MSINYKKGIIFFKGYCEINEAEELLEWIIKHPTDSVDFSECQHVHSTILFILKATTPIIVAYPQDENLLLWLKNIPFLHLKEKNEPLVKMKTKTKKKKSND